MVWSTLLRQRLGALSQRPSTLVAARFMGGGPRTFPGGLNKWQFKRMHEKMAREKERKLLEQEKQLYQARLRSQIRAEIAGTWPPPSPDGEQASDSSGHGPMTAKEHIKALADRFMKEGAEDLWNEDDGPLKDAPLPGRRLRAADPVPPLDSRKIVSDRRDLMDSGASKAKPPVGPFGQQRHYSVEARRGRSRPKAEIQSRWHPDSDSDLDLELEGGGRKKIISSAGLMNNYDRMKVRRPPKPVEEEDGGWHEEFQRIRDELEKKQQDAEEEFQRMRDELESMRDELEKKKQAAEEEFQRIRDELEKKRDELEKKKKQDAEVRRPELQRIRDELEKKKKQDAEVRRPPKPVEDIRDEEFQRLRDELKKDIRHEEFQRIRDELEKKKQDAEVRRPPKPVEEEDGGLHEGFQRMLDMLKKELDAEVRRPPKPVGVDGGWHEEQIRRQEQIRREQLQRLLDELEKKKEDAEGRRNLQKKKMAVCTSEEFQRIPDELEKKKQDAAGTGGNSSVEEESLFTRRR